MGVKVIKREYSERYTTNNVDWLLGNVGDWQKLYLDVEVGIDYFPTQAKPIEIDKINNSLILVSGENWGDFGFDAGMLCSLRWVKTTYDTNGNPINTNDGINQPIANIYGSTLVFPSSFNLAAQFPGVDSIPTNLGNIKISDVYAFSTKAMEGVRVKFAHIPNANVDNGQLTSLIDGSETEFALSGINNLPLNSFGVMEAIGIQSGASIRTMRAKRVSTSGYKTTYQIEVVYMISTIFDQLSDLENMTIPEYLSGDGSITDNLKINFYPEWNNPNVIVQNDIKQLRRLGNSGWFNENFNQLPNDFKIDTVEYFDENGNPAEALDFSGSIKVKAIISGVPNINAQTECGLGFAWIPKDENDYKNKLTPFYRNLFINSGDTEDGFKIGQFYAGPYTGGGVGGASMDVENVRFSNSGGKIICECVFKPNALFFSLFDSKDEDDRLYILYFSVADSTLIWNFSDRVTLLADFKAMTKNIPPAGEYDELTNQFLEHPQGDQEIGVDIYDGFVQDDILSRFPFRIPKDGSIKFGKIILGVEAFNIAQNRTFNLENYEIDLSQFPSDGNGVQQFAVDTTRGFKLENGNNKNWVKLERLSGNDTANFVGYIGYFATKIRYEDWILKNGVPNDFFKASEIHNGFNNDWINYLRTAGWRVDFFIKINATIDGGDLFQYKNSYPLKFKDYDENERIDTAHRYYRDSDDTFLNVGTDPETGRPLGVILKNEPTRIEIDFDIIDGGTWDLNNVYAVTTLEIDRGAGRTEMRQLSSVWGSESDNPLKPLSGETKLKITADPTFKILTTHCLVDPELLQDAQRYRITGRVGCYENGGQTFPIGLYENRYSETYE